MQSFAYVNDEEMLDTMPSFNAKSAVVENEQGREEDEDDDDDSDDSDDDDSDDDDEEEEEEEEESEGSEEEEAVDRPQEPNLKFESRFESGNLRRALKVGARRPSRKTDDIAAPTAI